MGGWTILVVFIAIAAALLGLWAYRRSPTPARNPIVKSKAGDTAEYWGVRISAPPGERACARVQEYLGKEFPFTEKPSLPLPDCPNPHQCQCRYIKLVDHRKGDRRSGHERRAAGLRFEPDKPPRRSGKDRRKKIDWY